MNVIHFVIFSIGT